MFRKPSGHRASFALGLAAILGSALDPALAAAADPPSFEVVTNPYTFGQAPDWMPDGKHVGWTRLNWNFVTDSGRGYWDIRVADYVDDARAPHLENVRVVHEGPGHYFETQHWSPDGCGFLFTEGVDTTLNLELFYLDLCKREDDPT